VTLLGDAHLELPLPFDDERAVRSVVPWRPVNGHHCSHEFITVNAFEGSVVSTPTNVAVWMMSVMFATPQVSHPFFRPVPDRRRDSDRVFRVHQPEPGGTTSPIRSNPHTNPHTDVHASRFDYRAPVIATRSRNVQEASERFADDIEAMPTDGSSGTGCHVWRSCSTVSRTSAVGVFAACSAARCSKGSNACER